MEFSRKEYWSGLPFSFPGGLPNPRINPRSPALQADSLPSEPPGKLVVALELMILLTQATIHMGDIFFSKAKIIDFPCGMFSFLPF